MSDVDALSSLPAALDASQNALADNNNDNDVNHQSLPGHSPPKQVSPPTSHGKDSDVAPKSKVDSADDGEQPLSPKADSEAETIIQPDRESVSPEKRRKFINHDPKRRDERNDNAEVEEGELPPNDLQVRRRDLSEDDAREEARDSDRHPSRSPTRGSPARGVSPSVVKIEKSEDTQLLPPRREESLPKVDRPHVLRKRSFSESVDGDGDGHGYRARQNRSVAPRGRGPRDLNGISFPRPASNERSTSPVRSSHKRTVSGPQLGASDASKKRKAPTPLVTGFSRQG